MKKEWDSSGASGKTVEDPSVGTAASAGAPPGRPRTAGLTVPRPGRPSGAGGKGA